MLVYPGSAHETAGTMRYAIQIDMKRVSVDRNIDGRYIDIKWLASSES